MTKELILYSTEGCHLCEMASELLHRVGLSQQFDIIDIAFNDELFSRYGVTIPVISTGSSELNWPFDIHQLTQWLNLNGITYHS
ncbi:glutaredoxin family protein [Vibrio sp. ZSDZ65]|uniref:Glutaredoxin family protein n=1 Tax=Vibrio qingdaonensis TaxID=2829491 RepID=A0A9X3HUP0_9VIBR|nr:glutaredoxin family protein [Vibrio qingdaonensis]MCW8344436.1 glutaredoxin family protein [Vibrio qingdaonensis]